VVVHGAQIQDRDGAKLVLASVASPQAWQRIWADGGYQGELEDWVQQHCGVSLEIVKRCAATKGFQLLPHRWVVERTLGWLGRFRRLSKDYEYLPEISEAMIHVAMICVMVRRLAKNG
jgi:putative transposase